MQTRSITTQASEAQPSTQNGSEFRPTFDVGFTTIVNLAILSTIAAIVYIIYVFKRQQSTSSFKPPDEMPCYRCRYFNNNPYLKCALHPANVLTDESIDCVNYRPENLSIAEKLFYLIDVNT